MKDNQNFGKTRLACCLASVTQAITANFTPLLFLTFHRSYGISLSELALIPVVFFVTQLTVDLACVKIADRFGYRACIITSEITSALGLAALAFIPDLIPNPTAGILACVVVYAIGSGLTEVLSSPIIEACPFPDKAKTMSLLHSFYSWGAVGVILLSTLFFSVFGADRWRILACLWGLIPLCNVYNTEPLNLTYIGNR